MFGKTAFMVFRVAPLPGRSVPDRGSKPVLFHEYCSVYKYHLDFHPFAQYTTDCYVRARVAYGMMKPTKIKSASLPLAGTRSGSSPSALAPSRVAIFSILARMDGGDVLLFEFL